MYSLIISFHLHLPFISSFTLVCIFMFTYWGVYIQCSTCLPSTSLYLLASLYHIVTWSKFNHVKSCIHSWGHESLWRGDMSQCEMVRIYLQLYLPYIPVISLFQVMFWFSNLTYFAHFALNLAPLISHSFFCQSSIQTSSFYSPRYNLLCHSSYLYGCPYCTVL